MAAKSEDDTGKSCRNPFCRSKIPKLQRKADGKPPKGNSNERTFSLDPEFVNFDYDMYESTIMNKETKPKASSGASAGSKSLANSLFAKVTNGLGIPQISSMMIGSSTENVVVSPESVKVLKAAPELDVNSNEYESNQEVSLGQSVNRIPSSDFMSDMVVWRRLEQSESDEYYDPQKPSQYNARKAEATVETKVEENVNEPLPHVQVFQTDSELKRKESKDRVNRVSVFINQITDIFMARMNKIEAAEDLEVLDKLQKQNALFKDWIESMYLQYKVTVDGFEEMEDLVATNLKEYREKTGLLKKKIRALESENRMYKKSLLARKSNSKFTEMLSEKIGKLNASLAEKEESLRRSEIDTKVLSGLIIRLRHGGIWDCNGMKGKLSPEVYNRLFKDQEDLSGKRLQYLDELDSEKAKLREQVNELRQKHEKVKVSLHKKQSEFEKIKNEEHRALKVLADAKAQKARIMQDIEELKQTRSSLQSSPTPGTLDDFVNM